MSRLWPFSTVRRPLSKKKTRLQVSRGFVTKESATRSNLCVVLRRWRAWVLTLEFGPIGERRSSGEASYRGERGVNSSSSKLLPPPHSVGYFSGTVQTYPRCQKQGGEGGFSIIDGVSTPLERIPPPGHKSCRDRQALSHNDLVPIHGRQEV